MGDRSAQGADGQAGAPTTMGGSGMGTRATTGVDEAVRRNGGEAARIGRTGGVRVGARRKGGVAACAAIVLGVLLAGCDSTPPDRVTHTAATTATTASASPTGADVPSGGPALTDLPARLESDGTTITMGDPSAPHTLSVYEDPRCPICERFEQANAAQVLALTKAGRMRVQYTLASFLDRNLGGGGSKRAVNALRAALDAGGFAQLHTLVYQYQPPETTDGFTTAYLLQLAGQVPGLRSATFDAAVRGQTYQDFVDRSEQAFTDSGAQGTPTLKIDGKSVPNTDAIFTAAGFKQVLAQHGIS
jgi:protein-disulfide isomerase